MTTLRRHVQKHALFPPLLTEPPDPELGLVVVIPAYNEPDIARVLDSLARCAAAHCAVEVLLVVNHPENASAEVVRQNHLTVSDIHEHAARMRHLRVEAIFAENLPVKKAGVGLARKSGMDEAVRRFAAVDNAAGVIACLDADCRVSENYLTALAGHFQRPGACTLYFEHDLEQCESPEHRLAIARYELHLRLYVNGLRSAGYPHAYHTIGSCMAVTAQAYSAHGGMNQRQAGEDFYFLSKYMVIDQMSELNEAAVFPSPRLSDRAPFGTGARTREWMRHPERALTYAPSSYDAVRDVLDMTDLLQNAPTRQIEARLASLEPAARDYLLSQNILEAIAEIRANSSSQHAFRKRWLRWLGPFRVMQLVRRVSDSQPETPVETAAAIMWGKAVSDDAEQWLRAYRRADRATSATGGGTRSAQSVCNPSGSDAGDHRNAALATATGWRHKDRPAARASTAPQKSTSC